MIEALVAGIASGTVVAVVQHYVLWMKQQHFQIRKAVFDDAVDALAMYEVDAMDIGLQHSNTGAGGIKPVTKLREQTNQQMTKALALVPAFFSPNTAHAYRAVYNAGLSPKNVPNSEYYQRLGEAMRMPAEELNPPPHSIFWPLLQEHA